MTPASAPPDPLEPARRTGRRVALVLFGAAVIGITLSWTVQIIRQVWFPPLTEETLACRPGVLALITSLRRARLAADAESGGDRVAVTRFRAALRPEWDRRADLTRSCTGDPAALRALREIDRLRYAEEHATRYEAVDLTRRRRDIAALERELASR